MQPDADHGRRSRPKPEGDWDRLLMPTLIECRTTPALFRQIAADLLPHGQAPDTNSLVQIYNRHKGNIRTSLRELYDTYAHL
jgi:hypothetical protein